MKKTILLRVLLCGVWLLTFSLLASAQNKQITGNVSDEKGSPIAGASVVAKGSRTGTTTGLDGNFTLSVSSSVKKIVISYVGYTSQDVILALVQPSKLFCNQMQVLLLM